MSIEAVLRQENEFGLVVVDLAKHPLAAGTLARSTIRNSNLDKAVGPFCRICRKALSPRGERCVQLADDRNRLYQSRCTEVAANREILLDRAARPGRSGLPQTRCRGQHDAASDPHR
jgi:hypothetical protein